MGNKFACSLQPLPLAHCSDQAFGLQRGAEQYVEAEVGLPARWTPAGQLLSTAAVGGKNLPFRWRKVALQATPIAAAAVATDSKAPGAKQLLFFTPLRPSCLFLYAKRPRHLQRPFSDLLSPHLRRRVPVDFTLHNQKTRWLPCSSSRKRERCSWVERSFRDRTFVIRTVSLPCDTPLAVGRI